MPKTRNAPLISPSTRAELRRIAAFMDESYSDSDGSVKSLTYTIVANIEARPAGANAVTVSARTLRQAVDAVEQIGAETIAQNRGRKTDLTTQQAADLLGVSRPYLVKLLDSGKMPCRLVGRYRRVRRADVEQFEQADKARRQAGLTGLAAFTQEIGLTY